MLIKLVILIFFINSKGNGHEESKKSGKLGDKSETYVFDMYNKYNYPGAKHLHDVINVNVGITESTTTEQYLKFLKEGLETCDKEFEPDFVLYNAGTDVLKGDNVGCLSISQEGVIERDYIVFKHFIEKKIPILYVTSGGYCKDPSNADLISESVKNMFKKLKLKEIAKENYLLNVKKK